MSDMAAFKAANPGGRKAHGMLLVLIQAQGRGEGLRPRQPTQVTSMEGTGHHLQARPCSPGVLRSLAPMLLSAGTEGRRGAHRALTRHTLLMTCRC